jgi:cell division transport system permease protein
MVTYGISGFLTELLAGESGLVALVGAADVWLISPLLVAGAVALAIATSWLALRRYVQV